MPDCAQCTARNLRIAQQTLAATAADLRRLDGCLKAVATAIEPDPQHLLSYVLPGVIEAVRRDVLADAIESLEALSATTEDDARVDYLAASHRLERVRADG